MTTGVSQNVVSGQQALHGDLHATPLTPESVNRLVDSENFHATNFPSQSRADTLARVLTPLRRPVAHMAAGMHSMSREPLNMDNPYVREFHMSQQAKPGVYKVIF